MTRSAITYFSSRPGFTSEVTGRNKGSLSPWIVASAVGVIALFVALNLWAAFGFKTDITDRPTVSLKPLQPFNTTSPNQNRSGSQTVSQPQEYPTGLYQAYLAARQNEGGAAYEVQTTAGAGYGLTNPAQQLTARFGESGATVEGFAP